MTIRRDKEEGNRKGGAEEEVKRKGSEGEGKSKKRGAEEGMEREGTKVWEQDGEKEKKDSTKYPFQTK